MKEPKDLGVKIGTEEEKAWRDLQKRTEDDTKMYYRQIEVNKAILSLCAVKIEQEKRKFK